MIGTAEVVEEAGREREVERNHPCSSAVDEEAVLAGNSEQTWRSEQWLLSSSSSWLSLCWEMSTRGAVATSGFELEMSSSSRRKQVVDVDVEAEGEEGETVAEGEGDLLPAAFEEEERRRRRNKMLEM